MIFAVMGGDERQSRLVRLLSADGHTVRAFAMEVAVLPPEADHFECAAEAVRGADCVVLPLPVTARRGYLNAPLSTEPHCIGEVLGALQTGQLCCAGMPDSEVRETVRGRGAVLRDYYAREELLAKNAVATAEGAIGVIMSGTDRTIWGRRVLIIGRGRLGRALAPRLRALGAEVSVSSRSAGDKAWAEADGFRAEDTRELEGRLPGFDIIVNTVPAPVLSAELLEEVRKDALIVDLASRPGGVDSEAARLFGLRFIHALSLPGKWAAETAAEAVRDAIYNILEEFD